MQKKFFFLLRFYFPLYLFLQLENIGNFVRAIVEYGLKPHDIFEANDLFENVNHTQVQSTLIALAGMVRVSSLTFPPITFLHGNFFLCEKYTERQSRTTVSALRKCLE